jgi:uncharacterized membrane protein
MEKDTSRIEAFSDGIFAVATTLLALEIGVDIKDMQAHHSLESTTNSELLQALKAEWPKYFAYFNSFASVLLMWMSHHQIFKLIRTTSNRLILVNGLLLLIIALVPFPTKTLGEFIGTGAQKMAIIFYTGYSVIVASVYVLFIHTVNSRNASLFLPNISPKTISGIIKDLHNGLFFNIIIFIIAFFAPVIALILNFCMWVFWAVATRQASSAN